eukprot:TRINITY_DN4307_c0_g1_i1.p1 TRINITY_DN4307_c0_g1~~TRINITY_DN4307_c0_g1_i1.p1  ORF type:complete len:105 (-),score=41.20 TRINITY_DN4307_c0_g1_i1:773-1087(-)
MSERTKELLKKVDDENEKQMGEKKFGVWSNEKILNVLPTYVQSGGLSEEEAEEFRRKLESPSLVVGDEFPNDKTIVFDLNGEQSKLENYLSNDKPTILNFGSYT